MRCPSRKVLILTVVVVLLSCTRFDPVKVNKVLTGAASDITQSSGILEGNILEKGDHGIDQHGFYYSTQEDPTSGIYEKTELGSYTSTGSFSENITGLEKGTTYYYRAYVIDSEGGVMGNVMSFVTVSATKPSVNTYDISSIEHTSAVGGGDVTDDGGASVSAKGVCWSTSQNPTIADSSTTDGSGPGPFTSYLTGLSLYTTYHVRAYATNSAGTAYGDPVTFKTSTVTDYEGNVYKTVEIGAQTWMAENLRTTHYNDGSPIPLETNTQQWIELSTPAYCWYDNNEAPYKDTYGAMYNNYTIESGKLCPSGWHVPTDDEWKILEIFAGMNASAADELNWRGTNEGQKLKATYGWNAGGNGTDDFGFSALPGGYRGSSGEFNGIGEGGLWWTSTEYDAGRTYYRTMGFDRTGIERYHLAKYMGWSVRCMQD